MSQATFSPLAYAEAMVAKHQVIEHHKGMVKSGFTHDEATAMIEGSLCKIPTLIPLYKLWIREYLQTQGG